MERSLARLARTMLGAIAALVVCVCMSLAISTIAFGDDTYTPEAQDDSGWQLTYTLSDDYTAVVSGVAQAGEGTLTIPASIVRDGTTYTVIGIAAGSGTAAGSAKSIFSGTGLQSIVLPDTITSVGNAAFAYCTELSSFTVASKVGQEGNYFPAVKTMGKFTFARCPKLTNMTFQEGTENIGGYTFWGNVKTATASNPVLSGLEKVTIPASVKTIDVSAFCFCYSLQNVVFEGDEMASIGSSAFRGCSSLTEITIPQLTATSNAFLPATSGGQQFQTFEDCTSLKKITFKSTNVTKGATGYFGNFSTSNMKNKSYFSGCELETVIWYGKRGDITFDDTSDELPNEYFALYFYADEQTAQAGDPNTALNTQPLLYKEGTSLQNILDGTLEEGDAYDEYTQNFQVSSLNAYLGDGNDWLACAGLTTTSTLSNTYALYPAHHEVSYDFDTKSYVTSDEIKAAGNEVSKPGEYYCDLGTDTVANLDDIIVKNSEGSVVSADDYTFAIEKRGRRIRTDGMHTVDDDFEWSAATADLPTLTEEGVYRIKAVSNKVVDEDGNYLETDWSYFSISRYTPTITQDGATNIAYTDDITSANTEALGSEQQGIAYNSSAYCLLVNANNPQAMLVAAGLAGVGGGSVVYITDDESQWANAGTAANGTNGSESVTLVAVGNADDVSEDAMTYLRSTYTRLKQGSHTRVRSTDEGKTIQSLALDGYTYITELLEANDPNASLGDTVLLCSGTASYDTMSIAQYAYEKRAPVLFAEADGTVSDATMEVLGKFKNIVVVGDQTYVPKAAEAAIEAACSESSVKRVMATGSAFKNSLELLDLLADEKYSATDLLKNIHIASASNPAGVVAAAQYASIDPLCVEEEEDDMKHTKKVVEYDYPSVALTVTTTGDFKELLAFLKEKLSGTGKQVECIDFVGSFTAGTSDDLLKLWQDYNNVETAYTSSDIFEASGSLYRVAEGGNAAQWFGLTDQSVAEAQILSVANGLPVTSVYSDKTLGEDPNLRVLTIGDNVNLEGLNNGFFDACTALECIYVTSQEQYDALDGVATAQVFIHTKHTPEYVAAVAPTCTEDGTAAYYTCKQCHRNFLDEACTLEVIGTPKGEKATGHTFVTDPYVAPTTSSTGLTEGSHCSACGTVKTAQTIIPMLSENSSGAEETVVEYVTVKSGTSSSSSKSSSTASSSSKASTGDEEDADADEDLLTSAASSNRAATSNADDTSWVDEVALDLEPVSSKAGLALLIVLSGLLVAALAVIGSRYAMKRR